MTVISTIEYLYCALLKQLESIELLALKHIAQTINELQIFAAKSCSKL